MGRHPGDRWVSSGVEWQTRRDVPPTAGRSRSLDRRVEEASHSRKGIQTYAGFVGQKVLVCMIRGLSLAGLAQSLVRRRGRMGAPWKKIR